ncbi:MAG: hypothetical protein LUC45_02235 [Paraprevotella sp.]|nr:hypothetical protein [Paraprevotella sp.]
MLQGTDYIATWFYRESHDEASFYPQAGGRGDSALLHSVYMQIQVPFFTTFRHYNSRAELLFFTNLPAEELPPVLLALFRRTATKVVTLPYRNKPPKGWYKAWMNQFYLYDILVEMERRMQPSDTLLVCDADCLCRTPLDDLFREVRTDGSSLYDMEYPYEYPINGTSRKQMDAVYEACYGLSPSVPLCYYGGEFVALRTDAVAGINREFPPLWKFNFTLPADAPRLHEEAHMLGLLAERLHLRQATANRYVKRMWTNRYFNNVRPGDERMPVWHLPSEKKLGLYYLYRMLERQGDFSDEARFWRKAGEYCGIPHIGLKKKTKDLLTTLQNKFKA